MMGAVFKRQIKADKLERNPIVKIDLPKFDDKRDRILTDEEFKRLLNAGWVVKNNGGTYKKSLEPHTRLALIIADYTGMRIGEILAIKWTDINLEAGKIFIRESKNGEKREVPVHDELKKILEANKVSDSGYIVNEGGKSLESIRRGFRMAREKAGLGDFRIHDLRHRAITRWIQLGFSPTVIMKASGHKTYSAFTRYSNLKGGDVMVLVGKKTEQLPLITYQDLQDIA